MDIYGIEPHLERAKSFLSKGEVRGFLYAALELRFCFEAIAYRHLALYGERIPSELVLSWKADQIIRTLAEFDPNSDQTAELALSIAAPDLPADASQEDLRNAYQGLDYLDLGAARRIAWRVFRRHYNALGSFLHLDREEANVYPTREKLEKIISILEDAASSKIIYAMTDIHTAVCDCGSLLVLGPAEREGRPFSCPNRVCNRIYVAQPDIPGSYIYKLETVLIQCPCGSQVPFHTERILKHTECPSCRSVVRAMVGRVAQIVPGPSNSCPTSDE